MGSTNGIVLGFGILAGLSPPPLFPPPRALSLSDSVNLCVGGGNVVRGNIVKSCQHPCNFSNAEHTQAANNTPSACDL